MLYKDTALGRNGEDGRDTEVGFFRLMRNPKNLEFGLKGTVDDPLKFSAKYCMCMCVSSKHKKAHDAIKGLASKLEK